MQVPWKEQFVRFARAGNPVDMRGLWARNGRRREQRLAHGHRRGRYAAHCRRATWCAAAGATLGLVACASTSASASADTSAQSNRERRRTPVVEAYERARPAVVNIAAIEHVEVQRLGLGPWGDMFRFPTERQSVGSGFIIHEDGYIVTNAHVVSAATQLKVTLADGAELPARVIGRDTRLDLAVIKVDPQEPLQPIPLGSSDDLMIGEQTIAIGNPVGLHNTVTTGVISALHRELEIDGRMVYKDIIQTDASINPGNSGGPLLNILGELIGVNTAIRTDAQNIGFAIPVDQLKQILPDVLDSEKLNRVVVGLSVAESGPPTVVEVKEHGPAARAGIRVGDVLSTVEGRPIRRGVDFLVAALQRRAGDQLELGVLRDGAARNVRLTLDELPRPDGRKLAREQFGLTLADVNENAVRRFQWPRDRGGVLVLAVEPRSAGDEADLQPGDLLVSVGRYWLANVDHLGTLLTELPRGEPIEIGLLRERRGVVYSGEVRIRAR